MPSTSRFRIPKAPVTGLYGAVMKRYAKRAFGEIPDGAYVYFHNKPVLKAVMGFEGRLSKWSALDPTLKSYAQLASAAVIGCSWCLDYGYFAARNDRLDLAKISQVPVWRESDLFDPLERDVLEYAEAMTATPPTVTDSMVEKLLEKLGAAAVVELTQIVAVENMRSRFNSAPTGEASSRLRCARSWVPTRSCASSSASRRRRPGRSRRRRSWSTARPDCG